MTLLLSHLYSLAIEFCVIVFLRSLFYAWLFREFLCSAQCTHSYRCEPLLWSFVVVDSKTGAKHITTCNLNIQFEMHAYWYYANPPNNFHINSINACACVCVWLLRVCVISVCKLYFGFYVLFHALSISPTTTAAAAAAVATAFRHSLTHTHTLSRSSTINA